MRRNSDISPLRLECDIPIRGIQIIGATLSRGAALFPRPNIWVQGTPGCAFLLLLSQVPGAPAPRRWAFARS